MRSPRRPLFMFLVALLLWFIAPHVHAATDCDSKYLNSGAYPADPMCPLNAAAADFGGLGGYVCGDPDVIAAYCSGPSGTDTIEPPSPEGSMPDPGQSNCSDDSTAGCGNSTSGADPVNLYSGQFYQYNHDLTVTDTAGSLELVRVYRSDAYDAAGKPLVGAFGVGMSFTYDTILAMSVDRKRLEFREATGIRVPFTPRAGSSRIWDNLTSPGEYYLARIDAVGSSGMTLTLRDGRVRAVHDERRRLPAHSRAGPQRQRDRDRAQRYDGSCNDCHKSKWSRVRFHVDHG
ncbi:DUF6531 domain-containing protein [Paraburkholderia panacisoli]|uniref:DUF6531 domain-containing protein n=1 Tax=Paraburkholderia panacisoli TaxID=2603818 RepID=UPI001FE28CE1|nr:DUF6531 domain-containing protein [Paraburkholderia panacisoli]